MAMNSFDQYINRIGGLFTRHDPVWDEIQTATTSTLLGNSSIGSIRLAGRGRDTPGSLPSGVTSFSVTSGAFYGSNTSFDVLMCRMIDLGSLNIAGPTFTDGSSMPTVTEMGVSRQTSSAVFATVETALNATPGSLQITYVDQDGNTAEANTAQTLTASAAARTAGIVVLNSGDTSVRDITTATRTGGTTPTGVIRFWGVIPIAIGTSTSNGVFFNPVTDDVNLVQLSTSNRIGFFQFGLTSTGAVLGSINLIGND